MKDVGLRAPVFALLTGTQRFKLQLVPLGENEFYSIILC